MKIPEKLKANFTKWYVKRGYKFGYDSNREAYWICPWYVRPLLIFFSPSIYSLTVIKETVEKLNEGLKNFSINLNDLAERINKSIAKSLDEYANKVKESEVSDDQISD